MEEDTIAAVATPQGVGGIGIVRLSGRDAFDIALKFFRSPGGRVLKTLESHRIYYGKVINAQNRLIDTVILLPMKSPRSYTSEDVVEFQCHGGLISVKNILETLLSDKVRLAEPGEFTKRAYLNGRIDIIQAESVVDIIRSKTDKSMNLALQQLNGDLSGIIKGLKSRYVEIGSTLETRIEFIDEDIETDGNAALIEELNSIQSEIFRLIESFRAGKFITEGVLLVLAGSPNVGKSSLLNSLLKEERAIVTNIPGTTRDFIEETIAIEGIPFRVTDTAGISHTDDMVEQEGVKRSYSKIHQADLSIFLLDGSRELMDTEYELAKELDQDRTIIVLNKSDLPAKITKEDIETLGVNAPVVAVSALNNEGMEDLKKALIKKLDCPYIEKERVLVSNERQAVALKKALEQGERVISALASNISEELVMVDLWSAIHALDTVTGDTYVDDMLDDIFSKFCIGK